MSSSISMLFSHVKKCLSGLFPSLAYIRTDVMDDADNHEDGDKWFSKINREVLFKMNKDKNSDVLCEAGGVEALSLALGSSITQGIPGDSEDLRTRHEMFGSNTYLETPVSAKGFPQFIIEASKDISVLLLLCSMILALVSGIKTDGWKDGWYDGVPVFFNMVAVIAVTAVCNFRQTKLFNKQSNENIDIQVSAIRSGEWKKVSVRDILVGDVIALEVGCQIPADGILILSENPVETENFIMVEEGDKIHVVNKRNPFLSFGMKVLEGSYCMDWRLYPRLSEMLVTAVGERTIFGTSRQGIQQRKTHFQAQFTKLSSYKENVCMVIALLLLMASFVDCILRNPDKEQDSTEVNIKKAAFNEMITAGMTFVKKHKVGLRASTTTATTFLLAIPEGFLLVVTHLVINSARRLLKDVRGAKVQKLFPCVTAGSVSAILTDKTSFLTTNRMTVTKFSLDEEVNDALTLSPKIRSIICQGIGLNTSSILLPTPDETAILSWAETYLQLDMEEVRRRSTILSVEARNPMKKGVWIRKTGEDGKATDVHWKGSAMMILPRCSHYYESNGIREFMSSDKRLELEKIVENMDSDGLKCMAFAHRQIIEGAEDTSTISPYAPLPKIDSNVISEKGLTLSGLLGLEYQCHQKAIEATTDCRRAGIEVVMVSNGNISVANALAARCGIVGEYTDKMVITAEAFRNFTEQERMEKADKVCVLANASSKDKLLLMRYLKQNGHVVAVTGTGMNDAPVLEEAHLRLSMGRIQILDEISDIIIKDNNLSSVTTILRWGRFTHDNIQKFIQFNLAFNIAAVAINSIATFALGEKAPFTTLQMLLMNLVIDFVGALALACELTPKQVMEPPVGRSKAALVTNVMWRNIATQALFQILIVLTLQFDGNAIFAVNMDIKKALAFNTFILCQSFNIFNARKLEEKNIFSGLRQNMQFFGTVAASLVLPVVVTELMGKLFELERLNWSQWGLCFAMAAVSWPVGFITKCIALSDSCLNFSFHDYFAGLGRNPLSLFCKWREKLKLSALGLPLVTKDVRQMV